jgi:polyhydroxyalkanoate synthesis repressor PhaR
MSEEGASESGSSDASGTEPKVIKRYTNRKLYDTVESRYVTLDEIAEMIKAGAEVKILDNRTKEDLTSVTLAQIIFEEEKKTSKVGLKVLRDMIRHGGERAKQAVENTQAEIRDRVAGLISRGHQTGDRARELVSSSQEALTQLQKRIDDRVRATLDRVTALPQLQKDLSQIAGRIEALEKRISALEK